MFSQTCSSLKHDDSENEYEGADGKQFGEVIIRTFI
jgi:hypothetical protein